MSTQALDDRGFHLLWERTEAALFERHGGPVSAAKFLQQPDRSAAAEYWTRYAVEMLKAVPENARLGASGSPTVLFPPDVAVTFELHSVTISSNDQPELSTLIRPLAAATITDALGHARWGARWDELIATNAAKTGPVVHTDGDREFPWIAQNPPVPGPWTSAKTEELAHRAARAEALGPKKIARLYERMRKRS